MRLHPPRPCRKTLKPLRTGFFILLALCALGFSLAQSVRAQDFTPENETPILDSQDPSPDENNASEPAITVEDMQDLESTESSEEPDGPAPMEVLPLVRLRALDKVTARTRTFEARVGSTERFGGLYIKTRACRKSSPLDTPESAAFLQIWEVTPDHKAQWIFSGWMFASSPALSSMDHPVYDVWVLECVSDEPAPAPTPEPSGATPEESQDQTPPESVPPADSQPPEESSAAR